MSPSPRLLFLHGVVRKQAISDAIKVAGCVNSGPPEERAHRKAGNEASSGRSRRGLAAEVCGLTPALTNWDQLLLGVKVIH